MPDFLLEIGCEEIPARMIDAAALDLRERIHKLLDRERLAASGDISSLDSPRRLAVLAAGIPATQPDVTEQVTGPSAAVAFKDGQPTPAAHAFAKKAGIDVSRLDRVTTPKGEYLSAKVTKKGRTASEVLARVSSQRDQLHLLAQEYVLAKAGRSICASGALAGCHAGPGSDSA